MRLERPRRKLLTSCVADRVACSTGRLPIEGTEEKTARGEKLKLLGLPVPKDDSSCRYAHANTRARKVECVRDYAVTQLAIASVSYFACYSRHIS